MKSKSSIFILVVVILLVVGGLVYYFAGKGGSTATSAPTTGLVSTNTGQTTGLAVATTGSTAQSTGNQVVSLLRNLSVIQLSDAVFQNPGFAMLQDISINLPPVTNQGRRNPFAPVGTDSASLVGIVSSTTTATGSASSTLPVGSATGTVSGH